MSKDPAALFYIDTWLSSTAEMDADTRGWYLNLILHQYDKGDLPNDIERLAQLAMVKFSEYERWQQVWQQVLQHKFQQNDNGRLENSKVNEMLQKREVFKNKRSMAGKISRVVKVANKMKSLHCGVDEIKEYLKNNPDHEIFEHLDNQQVLQQMLKQVSQQVLQLFRNEDGNENKVRDNDGDTKGKSITHLSDSELGGFKEAWIDYLQHRKEIGVKKYKSEKSERIKFKELIKLSGKDPEAAQRIVDQSRGNSWTGLYKITPQDEDRGKNGNPKPQNAIFKDKPTGLWVFSHPANNLNKDLYPLLEKGGDGNLHYYKKPGAMPINYEQIKETVND